MCPDAAEDLLVLEVGSSCGVLGKPIELLFGGIRSIDFQLALNPCLNSVFELSLNSLARAKQVPEFRGISAMHSLLHPCLRFPGLGLFCVFV